MPNTSREQEGAPMADERKEPWMSFLTLTTGTFAVCATLSTLKGGGYVTRAVMSQSQASDQWRIFRPRTSRDTSMSSRGSSSRWTCGRSRGWARPSGRITKSGSDVSREGRSVRSGKGGDQEEGGGTRSSQGPFSTALRRVRHGGRMRRPVLFLQWFLPFHVTAPAKSPDVLVSRSRAAF